MLSQPTLRVSLLLQLFLTILFVSTLTLAVFAASSPLDAHTIARSENDNSNPTPTTAELNTAIAAATLPIDKNAQLTHPEVFALPMRRSQGGNMKASARAASGSKAYQRLVRAQSYGAKLNREQDQQRKHTMAFPSKTTPLSGCPFADFTIPVIIGRTSFDLIVDTGSSTLAVAGATCTTCTGVSPKWQVSASSVATTFTGMGAYGDGSGWSGKVWSERVGLGNGTATFNATAYTRARIVVITQQSTEGRDQAGNPKAGASPFFNPNPCYDVFGTPAASQIFSQGIIGVGYPTLAVANTDSWIFKLFDSQPNLPKQFSIQMCEGSGTMWVGGSDASKYIGQPKYTAITEKKYYSVAPSDILINGRSLNFTDYTWRGPNIIDSGTTLWELPGPVYDAVVDYLINNGEFKKYFRSNSFTDNFFTNSSGFCETAMSNPIAGSWQHLQEVLPTISLVLKDGLTLTMDGVGRSVQQRTH